MFFRGNTETIKFSPAVEGALRKLYDTGVVGGETVVDGHRVILLARADLIGIAAAELHRCIEPVALFSSMYCTLNVVWVKYLFQDAPADTELYLLISNVEG